MPAHRAPKRFLWPPIRSDLLRRRDNPRHRPPRRCRSLWVARQSGAPCGLRERREGLAACLRQRVLAFGLLAFCASPVLGPFFSAPSSIPPRRRCACPFAFSLTQRHIFRSQSASPWGSRQVDQHVSSPFLISSRTPKSPSILQTLGTIYKQS